MTDRRTTSRVHAAAVEELASLVRLPNNVEHPEEIEANAVALRTMFHRRGFDAELWETPSRRPAVFASLESGQLAAPTLLVYSHYDGVPPGRGWHSDPYEPILRTDAPRGDTLGMPVPWPLDGRFDPTWRLVGRSSADSKASIIAVLGALDTLAESGRRPAVNLKVILDGEEERESPGLPGLLSEHATQLAADAVVYTTGETHPSGLPTLTLGARGILILRLTVWTAASSAHSGHFGGFVPNAALALARLLATLKDDDGRVAVDGFEDGITPLGRAERRAQRDTPVVDAELLDLFSIAHPESRRAPWHEMLGLPTLNIRGVSSGAIGSDAANVIPHRATAELDIRLVVGMDPETVERRIVEHLQRAGATIFNDDPTPDQIRRTSLLVTVNRLAGFRATRTSIDHPVARHILEAGRRGAGGRVVVEPTEGGSLPLFAFSDVAPVVLGLPTANHDNRQHAADENLQLGFLFRAIDVWASILGTPGPVRRQ